MPQLVDLIYGGHPMATMEVRDPDGWIQRSWMAGLYYEQHMLQHIACNYQGGTFIDVGASIGNHTVFFGLHCKPDLIAAFEPYPPSFQHMIKNVSRNKLWHVEAYPAAVSNVQTLGVMKLPEGGNEGMYYFEENEAGTVQTVTLDDYRFQDVRLIKVDAERCEIAILKGAMETLQRCKPVIFIEAITKVDLNNIFSLLQPLGYKIMGQFNATPTYELIV